MEPEYAVHANKQSDLLEGHLFEVNVKYFEVASSIVGDEEVKEEEKNVHCEFSLNLKRTLFDQLAAELQAKKADMPIDESPILKQMNVLFIFADKSGSMSGSYFNAMKEGMLELTSSLFPEDEAKKPFQEIHTVFYSSHIFPTVTNTKEAYTNCIANEKAMGQTNFVECFQYVSDIVGNLQEGAKVSIIFLTDGLETRNDPDTLQDSRDSLKAKLQSLSESKSIDSNIYCLGFSESHDAELLNFCAQAGSDIGNFIYIDTGVEGYQEQLLESFSSCLGMAVSSTYSKKLQMQIVADGRADFKFNRVFEEKYKFSHENDDGEFVMVDEVSDTWTSILLTNKSVLALRDLTDERLQVTLNLGNGIKVQGRLQLEVTAEPPLLEKTKADLSFVNDVTFKLIQQIQSCNSKEDRELAFKKLRKIDSVLDDIMVSSMRLKEKEVKKELLAAVHRCKQATSNVVSLLRQVQDLSHLPNSVIAQMNDHAYKAQRSGLSKMLDKRALKNEEQYQKTENDIADIVSKLDFEELGKKYTKIVEDIGECSITCMSTIEALEAGECMCIGLQIDRPQAAIADPSRLNVRDIIPIFTSSEAFMNSAKYMLSRDRDVDVHGGFHAKDTEIMKGLGNEKVNGVMPLYLFYEHWNIARRRASPILGFMTTLDVLGFTNEQLETVPFLVLAKAYEKITAEPTEMNRKIFALVEETCVQLVTLSASIRDSICKKVLGFAYQASESTRAQDSVKSIRVLIAQFLCLLKVNHKKLPEEHKEHLTNKYKLADIKRRIARFSVEESLRRMLDEQATNLKENLQAILLGESVIQFKVDVFNQMKDAILAKDVDEESESAKQARYAKLGQELQASFSEKLSKEDAAIMNQISELKKPKSNLEEKISDYLMHVDWLNRQHQFMDHLNKEFVTNQFTLEVFFMIKKMLGGDAVSIFDLPLLEDDSAPLDDKKLVILAVNIQNGLHCTNAKRKEAVADGSYVSIESASDAHKYLYELCLQAILVELKNEEKKIVMDKHKGASEQLIDMILRAPDQFVAAAIMKSNDFYLGRGDFFKALQQVGKPTEAGSYPDLANKLQLLKLGYLCKQGLLPDLNQPVSDTSMSDIEGTQRQLIAMSRADAEAMGNLALYTDRERKLTDENRVVNYKMIFKIWAEHAADDRTDITAIQLQNVFPEFHKKLALYDMCCDKTGKIVRNQDFYNKYRAEPHMGGIRSKARQTPEAKAARKQFKDKREEQLQRNNKLSYENATRYLEPTDDYENNALKKMEVGEVIFPFVVYIVGESDAPKVSGMLIDMKKEDVAKFLGDFEHFQKVAKLAQKMWQAEKEKKKE